MRGSSSAKGGFTLIELLVVIGIILVLASILTPALLSAKKKADVAKCITNVKGIGTAMMLYAQDNENSFPYGADTMEIFGLMYNTRDFSEVEVYKCPSTRTKAPLPPAGGNGQPLEGVANRTGVDYFVVAARPAGGGSNETPSLNDPSSNVLLIEDYTKGASPAVFDDGDNHNDGGNLYYINGSAKYFKVDTNDSANDTNGMPQNRGYNDNIYFTIIPGTCIATNGVVTGTTSSSSSSGQAVLAAATP